MLWVAFLTVTDTWVKWFKKIFYFLHWQNSSSFFKMSIVIHFFRGFILHFIIIMREPCLSQMRFFTPTPPWRGTKFVFSLPWLRLYMICMNPHRAQLLTETKFIDLSTTYTCQKSISNLSFSSYCWDIWLVPNRK